MLNTTKKLGGLTVIFTVIVAVLSTSGFAYAQWRSNHDASNTFDWGQWNRGLPAQVALSQPQMKATQKIWADCEDSVASLQRELQNLQLEAQTYYASPDAQVDKIKAYRRQINDLQEKIADLRRAANTEINDLLNSDQRSYFGYDFDWCDLGYGDQMSNCGYGDHMMNHDSHMNGWCRWDNYPQNRRTHSGHGGCCW